MTTTFQWSQALFAVLKEHSWNVACPIVIVSDLLFLLNLRKSAHVGIKLFQKNVHVNTIYCHLVIAHIMLVEDISLTIFFEYHLNIKD